MLCFLKRRKKVGIKEELKVWSNEGTGEEVKEVMNRGKYGSREERGRKAMKDWGKV